jgi:hypothetical protein
MFVQHKNKVDKVNEEKNYGGLSSKNDKAETLYASISKIN